MTLQTPQTTWQRDLVNDDDPRWPGDYPSVLNTSHVVAMPAPGYAICFGEGPGDTSGFIEVSFATDGSEILDLDFTMAHTQAEFDAIYTQPHTMSPTVYSFPDEFSIVVVYLSTIGFVSYRATYSTTFGSLSVDVAPGYLQTTKAGVDNPGCRAIPIDADTIVWTFACTAQIDEFEVGKPVRHVSFFDACAVGASGVDAWSTANRIEPEDVDPAATETGTTGDRNGLTLCGLYYNATSSTVAAIGGMGRVSPIADHYVSAEISSSGGVVTSWTQHATATSSPLDNTVNVGSRDLWHTLPDTEFGPYTLNDPIHGDLTKSIVIGGDWYTTSPALETELGAEASGYFQPVEDGLMEGRDGSVTRRTWDTSTGENIEAFFLSGSEMSRCQADGVQVWLRYASGIYTLHTLAPPEPDPFEPDPEVPHNYCLEAADNPDFNVEPDADFQWAMGRDDRLTYVGYDWDNTDPGYVWDNSYRIVGFPDTGTLHFRRPIYYYQDEEPFDWFEIDPPYSLCTVGDTIYWFERDATGQLHAGFGGSAVWSGDNDYSHTIAWSEADSLFYVLRTELFIEQGWDLIAIDPSDWSSSTVASSATDVLQFGMVQPVVTPDGAVWWSGFYDEDTGLDLWFRYDGSLTTSTFAEADPYWGLPEGTPWPNQTEAYHFIPVVDNSVWFVDGNTSLGYRLSSTGSISRVPLLDSLNTYEFQAIGPAPDSTVTALYTFYPEDLIWRLYICGGGGWGVGAARWGF